MLVRQATLIERVVRSSGVCGVLCLWWVGVGCEPRHRERHAQSGPTTAATGWSSGGATLDPSSEGYAPDSCVDLVQTLCAPNLDDQPGAEVIAEIRYRVPPMTISDTPTPLSCGSKQRYAKGILVVLSPPNPERAEWRFVASLGSTITGPEVEGGYCLAINHFVELPDGRRAVFVHAINPGFSDEFEEILGLERGATSFRVLASRGVPVQRRRQRQ